MTYLPVKGGNCPQVTLASAVVDTGTFTVPYPTGMTQLSFNAGLAKYGASYAMIDSNNKVAEGSGGIALAFGASEITVTNNTGATLAAGTKVDLFCAQWTGNSVMQIAIPIALAGVTAADVVTEMRPGVEGYITHVEWVQGVPVTTGGDAATLNLEIDTTNLTGGTVALTSAACTPLGKAIAGSQITAGNRLVRESKLSVEASSVTAFAEGDGVLLITVRLDTL